MRCQKYLIGGMALEVANVDTDAMNCTLCDSTISQCASCRSSSCTTALCSRCAIAQPDAHPVPVAAGSSGSLGEPVVVLMDW